MNHSKPTIVPTHATLFLAMVILTSLAGCRPETGDDPGDPYDKVVGLYGAWDLQTVFQRDEVNDFLEDVELTSFYRDEVTPPMVLTLNQDSTYTIVIERGKNFFGEQGNWGIDNPEFPSYLDMRITDALDMEIDSIQANLGSVVRPHDNQMTLILSRFCNEDEDIPFPVTYLFNFIRK